MVRTAKSRNRVPIFRGIIVKLESSLCGGARYGPIAEAHLEKESRAKEDINE
jgi:hypothetical protein